jgi:hypothetical protein
MIYLNVYGLAMPPLWLVQVLVKMQNLLMGSKNTFPSWAELGDVFYEKVNGEKTKRQ